MSEVVRCSEQKQQQGVKKKTFKRHLLVIVQINFIQILLKCVLILMQILLILTPSPLLDLDLSITNGK